MPKHPYLDSNISIWSNYSRTILYSIWGYELSPLMAGILYKAIGSSNRTAKSTLEQILEYTKKNSREDVVLSTTALYNRLYPLKDALEAMDISGHKITRYINQNKGTTIDLSNIDTRPRTAYGQAIIAYMYRCLTKKGISNKPRLFIFVDEAHNLFPRRTEKTILPIEEAFVEARKIRVKNNISNSLSSKTFKNDII